MLLSLLITQPSRCHHHGAHWGVLLAPQACLWRSPRLLYPYQIPLPL